MNYRVNLKVREIGQKGCATSEYTATVSAPDERAAEVMVRTQVALEENWEIVEMRLSPRRYPH